MRVRVDDEFVEVLLAPWEKALGLMGNIKVRRSDVEDARVVADPMRAVMGAGLKAGLRLPFLYYVARSIRLDRAFVVKRGVPALSFGIRDGGRLQSVLVSTPEAAELARRLSAP